jgi:hypothetical protein
MCQEVRRKAAGFPPAQGFVRQFADLTLGESAKKNTKAAEPRHRWPNATPFAGISATLGSSQGSGL